VLTWSWFVRAEDAFLAELHEAKGSLLRTARGVFFTSSKGITLIAFPVRQFLSSKRLLFIHTMSTTRFSINAYSEAGAVTKWHANVSSAHHLLIYNAALG
jgi:hypothetical protein